MVSGPTTHLQIAQCLNHREKEREGEKAENIIKNVPSFILERDFLSNGRELHYYTYSLLIQVGARDKLGLSIRTLLNHSCKSDVRDADWASVSYCTALLVSFFLRHR